MVKLICLIALLLAAFVAASPVAEITDGPDKLPTRTIIARDITTATADLAPTSTADKASFRREVDDICKEDINSVQAIVVAWRDHIGEPLHTVHSVLGLVPQKCYYLPGFVGELVWKDQVQPYRVRMYNDYNCSHPRYFKDMTESVPENISSWYSVDLQPVQV